MKGIVFLLLICFFSFSCKREFTCECVLLDHRGEEMYSSKYIYDSRFNAKSDCAGEEGEYEANTYFKEVSCDLEH